MVCHAWVLMDNHYHLLLETPAANLSVAMKHLNALYTQKFNKKHYRVGHLFQGRYKALVVEKETYLKELCRYVVLNLVRAHMVKHPRNWKWSGYRTTAGYEKLEPWFEIDWILGQFGKDWEKAQMGYRRFVEEGRGKKVSPWDSLFSRVYLGGKEFLSRVHEVGQKHKHLDVPKYQKYVVKQEPQKIIHKVANAYGEKVEELLRPGRKRAESRDVAVYLLKKESGLSLREIGRRLGIGATAAGNRWAGMKGRVIRDRNLAVKIDKLIEHT